MVTPKTAKQRLTMALVVSDVKGHRSSHCHWHSVVRQTRVKHVKVWHSKAHLVVASQIDEVNLSQERRLFSILTNYISFTVPFFNIRKILPSSCSLILLQGTYWNIQRCIMICIITEVIWINSKRIFDL